MNDSFLEDLGLLSEEPKKIYQQADCYITTRNATSSPLLKFSEQNDRAKIMESQKAHSAITVPNMSDMKITGREDLFSKDSKKQPDQDTKKHSIKVKLSEKIEKTESKIKTTDVKTKMGNNQQHGVSSREAKIKLQKPRHVKVPENKTVNKEYNRRSGSYKEITHSLGTSTKENKHSPDSSNNHSSDISNKDNSHPSDSSKESGPRDSAKKMEKLPANLNKFDYNMQNQDPVVLTAIKELTNMTKQESMKILRIMQEIYVNSQVSLVKNLLNQTDELIKEMHSDRERSLIVDNERLQQELIALKTQDKDLQNNFEEFEFLKRENAALKRENAALKRENAALKQEYDEITQNIMRK